MEHITKERIKEILEISKTKTDLFNWCEEYKQFINNCVCQCVSSEWDYMIKKSYEDGDCPIDAEELKLSDYDQLREELLYSFENDTDKQKEFIACVNDPDTFNRKVKTKSDFEVFLNSLSDDELIDLSDKFDLDIPQLEIYEWWIISNPLAYRLEKQGEIFLNYAWGRCTTGQDISLDYCCRKAFLSILEDWL